MPQLTEALISSVGEPPAPFRERYEDTSTAPVPVTDMSCLCLEGCARAVAKEHLPKDGVSNGVELGKEPALDPAKVQWLSPGSAKAEHSEDGGGGAVARWSTSQPVVSLHGGRGHCARYV